MSLMTSPSLDRFEQSRHPTCAETSAHAKVNLRHKHVLELALARTPYEIIEELTGYSRSTIYSILSNPSVIALKQQIMQVYDIHFEGMYKDFIEVLKDGMNFSNEDETRLKAAALWQREFSSRRLPEKEGESSTGMKISAEKVIFNILNQNGGNGASASNLSGATKVFNTGSTSGRGSILDSPKGGAEDKVHPQRRSKKVRRSSQQS